LKLACERDEAFSCEADFFLLEGMKRSPEVFIFYASLRKRRALAFTAFSLIPKVSVNHSSKASG